MRHFARVAAAALIAAGAGALAAQLATTSPKPLTVTSVSLSPDAYSLSVDHGDIAVSDNGNAFAACTRLFDPTTLRLVGSIDSCSAYEPDNWRLPIVVDFGRDGDEIHVRVTNPATHQSTVGPLLTMIDNWSWAHSGVTSDDGSVWIWNLNTKVLIQASTTTGLIEHRWSVDVGADPWMAVNDDGFWMTEGVWDGSFCSKQCALWHIAPGSDDLVVVRTLDVGTQWFEASAHSLFLDELTAAPGGYQQSVWRLDGPDAEVAYETPASLLPGPTFGGTGYVVDGDPVAGYFTVSQLGTAHTEPTIGQCDSSAPMRIVRIDPTTGRQAYAATLPRRDSGSQPLCALDTGGDVSLYYEGAFYLLAGSSQPGFQFATLVRVSV